MLMVLALLAAPYFVRRKILGLPPANYLVGFLPPGLAAKGAGLAKSQMAARSGGGSPAPAAGPSPMAMAALGPAALLTTPQGKAGVAKGLTLLKSAAKGNPKAKAKVARTKRRAAAGDPQAKRDLAALKAAQMVQEEVDDMDEDEDQDELEGDWY